MNQDTKSDGFSKGMLEEVCVGSAKARVIIQVLKTKSERNALAMTKYSRQVNFIYTNK